MSDGTEPIYPQPEKEAQIVIPPELSKEASLVAPDGLSITSDDPEVTEAPHQLPFPVVGEAPPPGEWKHISSFSRTCRRTPAWPSLWSRTLRRMLRRSSAARDSLVIRPWIRSKSRMAPDRPNRIYFLPPNAQVSIEGGRFRLKERVEDGSPRPIDFFFRSLAADQKNRAIGVVLSGMDSDGALGLKAIKGEGGIAMVQSPESARFPDMPRSSISADHVDIVLPPGQLAFELAQLSRQFETLEVRLLEDGASPNDEQHLARIITLLRGVSGVDFRMYKPTTIRRRIARQHVLHRIGSLADYVGFLQGNPKEFRA